MNKNKEKVAKELLSNITETLRKFEDIHDVSSLVSDTLSLYFTLGDAHVLQKILNSFLYGSYHWNIEFANNPTSYEGRIIVMTELDPKDFNDDLDNIEREINYKICLLKTALGT